MGLILADARSIPLRDGCVQCVVTSPPYFGLRDYGHTGQIGLESSPAAYVSALIGVFAEVRRVLAADGVLWLNLGDSYAGGGGFCATAPTTATSKSGRYGTAGAAMKSVGHVVGFKTKDLLGIPWRVAFALQADGWYLRSDVIWSKPNPMPESVTDRPTKAHEYLFLLTKSSSYYYDAQAIAEPVSAAMLLEMEQGYNGLGLKDYEAAGVQNPSSVKARIIANAKKKQPTRGDGYGAAKGGFNGRTPDRDGGFSPSLAMTETSRKDGDRWRTADGGVAPRGLGRNRRSVWTVATKPFTGWTQTSRRVRVSWDESDDDTTRTTSPNCPVHGDRAVLAAKALCGGRGADSLIHSARTDDGHGLAPLLDSAPTVQRRADCLEVESLDSSGPSHAGPAIGRSSRSRRTDLAPVTSLPCTPSDESLGGIGDTSALPRSTVDDSRTLESSMSEPADLDAAVSAEIPDGTLGKCSCDYFKIITEKQSHFATMPEKLVEPCILAGSRLGDWVYDPFCGSGTVGRVAERLGRRWVGTDLNPAYHELAKKRTAQRGLRFVEASA